MGYVVVKFLGEEYQVSETINEFLSYDELLTPIRTKMLNMISTDVKRDSRLSWDADTMTSHIHGTADKYRRLIEDATELLVKKLLELGVYDVTSNDLLKEVTSIGDINALEKITFATLLQEGQKYVDMKNAGAARAYNYAARNITGSGVRVFTSSFSTLVINSMVERSILLSQAKKADREYEEAVRNISAQTINALDTLYREVMVKEFYPSIVQTLLEFDSKVMSVFLVELTTHGKFDFESVEKYNMQKAEEMLKNINQVQDKVGFLKQAFLTCPFSLEVYEVCLRYGLLDKETFDTAKYFGFADELAESIDSIIRENLKNTVKITPLITILALHRGTDEIGIWKKIYESTLENIEDTYKSFSIALSDKRELDKWIRQNICQHTGEIIKMSLEKVKDKVHLIVNDVVSQKSFQKFTNMGLLSAETIRLKDSLETDLEGINVEFEQKLVACIDVYIQVAKIRGQKYDEAYDKFSAEVKKKNDAIAERKTELDSLGMFAFTKRKELKNVISDMETELYKYKSDKEPKDLQRAFERMYG